MRKLFVASLLLLGLPFARHGIVKGSARAWRRPLRQQRMPVLPHHQECGRPQGSEPFQRGGTKSKEAIRAQILNGSKVMPAFGDVLQPAELDDLVAYLRSCKDKPIK